MVALMWAGLLLNLNFFGCGEALALAWADVSGLGGSRHLKWPPLPFQSPGLAKDALSGSHW